MTKKEIVKTICDRANKKKLMKSNLTQLATKEIVQWTFEAIIETLVQEGRIELRNFGVFEVKQRKPRKARNPRTGAAVSVEAKNVVTFQPGKEMEEQVRKFAKPAEPKKKTRRSKAAKSAEPKATEPKAVEPKVVEPKVVEPKVVEPKVVEPKVVEPLSNGTGLEEHAHEPLVGATATATKPMPEPVTSDAS